MGKVPNSGRTYWRQVGYQIPMIYHWTYRWTQPYTGWVQPWDDVIEKQLEQSEFKEARAIIDKVKQYDKGN